MTKTLLIILTVITLQTCISSTPPINYSEPIWEPQTEFIQGMKKAYFASGCFWCVEAVYESVKGVQTCAQVMQEDLQKIPITIR